MNAHNRHFLLLSFTTLLCAVLGFSSVANTAVLSNQPHPLVSTLGLNKIASEFVLVNVWSPFCEPCSEEVGVLNELARNEAYRQTLTIIGVPAEGRKPETEAFIAHFKPEYQQVTVAEKKGKAELLLLGQVPTTILFDLKRTIIKQWSGKISADEILSAISSLKNRKE